jgi:hypothetical protein
VKEKQMSWFVDKTNHDWRQTTQAGEHKTGDDARAAVRQLKGQEKAGDSNTFTVREGRRNG